MDNCKNSIHSRPQDIGRPEESTLAGYDVIWCSSLLVRITKITSLRRINFPLLGGKDLRGFNQSTKALHFVTTHYCGVQRKWCCVFFSHSCVRAFYPPPFFLHLLWTIKNECKVTCNLESKSTRKQNWRQTEQLISPSIAGAGRGCPWQRGGLRTTCVCSLAFPNLRENGQGWSHGSQIGQAPWEYKSRSF